MISKIRVSQASEIIPIDCPARTSCKILSHWETSTFNS